MPVKTKIDVGADVEKFRESFNLFQKYQAALKEQYGIYVNQAPHIKAAADAGSQFENFINLDEAVKAQDRISTQAQKSHKAFSDLATGITHFMTRSAASSIGGSSGVIASTLRMVGGGAALEGLGILGGPIGLLAATLVGAGVVMGIAVEGAATGAFWGLAGAAPGVSDRRRLALGLGTTYGALNALDLNFARFGVDEGTLSNVAAGAYNIASPQFMGLRGAGISGRGDTSDAAIALMRSIPELLKGVPDAMVGPIARSRGLTSILSLDQIIRLRQHPEEIESQIKRYQQDRKTLDISAEAQKKWSEFNATLQAAGQKIESALGRSLVSLTPALTKFSSAAVNVIDAFVDSGTMTDALRAIRSGLAGLVGYIGSPKFKEDAKSLIHAIEALGPYAAAIGKIADLAIKGARLAGEAANGGIGGIHTGSDSTPEPHVSVGTGDYSIRYYAGHPQDRPKYGGIVDEKTGKLLPKPGFIYSPRYAPHAGPPSAIKTEGGAIVLPAIEDQNRAYRNTGTITLPGADNKLHTYSFVTGGGERESSPDAESIVKRMTPTSLGAKVKPAIVGMGNFPALGGNPPNASGTPSGVRGTTGWYDRLPGPEREVVGRPGPSMGVHVVDAMHKAPAQPIVIDNNTGAAVTVSQHEATQ